MRGRFLISMLVPFGLVVATGIGAALGVPGAAADVPPAEPRLSTEQGTSAEASFRNDVLPTLTKAGCNQGACHGAARGKDGFQLSLRGYDIAGDHERLLEEMPGRRVNLDAPEASLLLRKAAGLVPHTGGGRIAPHTPEYETLLRWIEEGARDDTQSAPRIAGLHLDCGDRLEIAADETQPLVVTAMYSDGTTRDVTRLCQFKSSDPESVQVTPDGAITAAKSGEAFVTASLNPMIVGVRTITARSEKPPETTWPAERNDIDRHVFAKLRSLGVTPSETCDDAVFARRVYLDLNGRLPSPDEVREFEADTRPEKRRRLAEQLVEREAFVDLWTTKWADRLRLRSKPPLGVSAKGAKLYHGWIRESIGTRMPLDEFAAALLTATGPGFENPESHFYQFETDTLNTAEDVAQVFLGLRLKCARCHNHPFDRWTQDDYYGFAAFFAQVGRKKTADPREYSIHVDTAGKLEHPLHGTVVEPRVLGNDDGKIVDPERDRRAVVAEWLTSRRNPYFARHMANIVWDHHFGRGIVDPVDDVRISNPPVNEPLLDALADELVAGNFDLRTLVVSICNSATYQLSSVPNETNENERRNFACWPVRRLSAEVLLDAICTVTESPEKLPRLTLGASAIQLVDGADTSPFLATFGRAARTSVCACEARTAPTLSQSLHLVNGGTINDRIRRGRVVRRLLDGGATPTAVAEELAMRCLARRPTADELAELERSLSGGDAAADVLEDFLWALLNSKEFLFQH